MRSMETSTTLTTEPVGDHRLAEILANPGFGQYFTDHMFTVRWNPGEGWHQPEITPYGPLTLDPATAVLHYAHRIAHNPAAFAEYYAWDVYVRTASGYRRVSVP